MRHGSERAQIESRMSTRVMDYLEFDSAGSAELAIYLLLPGCFPRLQYAWPRAKTAGNVSDLGQN